MKSPILPGGGHLEPGASGLGVHLQHRTSSPGLSLPYPTPVRHSVANPTTGGNVSLIYWTSPDSPPDMVGSCLVCFQGVSGCRPGVRHDMIGHRTGSRAPSLRVSAAVRCQLWLLSVRRRHGPAWQLGRVAYKPMLQAGSLCSIRLGSQRQYPLPRPEQQLV